MQTTAKVVAQVAAPACKRAVRPSRIRIPTKRRTRGFTLIELLVSIGVIALLMGLVLPALGGAMDQARSVSCVSNLSTIHRFRDLWSSSHDDYLPTPFHDEFDKEFVGITFDNVRYHPHQDDVGDVWLWVTDAPRAGASAREFEAFSCPTQVRQRVGIINDHAWIEDNPHSLALSSYFESPTLTSDPAFWAGEPGERSGRDLTKDDRRRVRVHDVLRPSDKAVLAERADFHSGDMVFSITEPQAKGCNVLFQDGHAARVQIADALPTHRVRSLGFRGFSPWASSSESMRVPFLATIDGYRGSDVAAAR